MNYFLAVCAVFIVLYVNFLCIVLGENSDTLFAAVLIVVERMEPKRKIKQKKTLGLFKFIKNTYFLHLLPHIHRDTYCETGDPARLPAQSDSDNKFK